MPALVYRASGLYHTRLRYPENFRETGAGIFTPVSLRCSFVLEDRKPEKGDRGWWEEGRKDREERRADIHRAVKLLGIIFWKGLDTKMKLERAHIEAGRTGPGGWSRRQLEVLGVTWPPSRGWIEALAGKEVSEADFLKFLLARKNSR